MTIKSSFRFERINKVDRYFSHWQVLSFVFPLKYHTTLLLSWMIESLSIIHAFLPTILKRVQRCRVSWIRSIAFKGLKITGLERTQMPFFYCCIKFGSIRTFVGQERVTSPQERMRGRLNLWRCLKFRKKFRILSLCVRALTPDNQANLGYG